MKYDEEEQCRIDFVNAISPAITLLDVEGRKHPVVNAFVAGEAIAACNELYEVGGTGKVSDYSDGETCDDVFLVFYNSDGGRPPKRAEIARAARTISNCHVTLMNLKNEPVISGRRAVAYPERAGPNGAVPILISTRVWYNRNRSTVNFPANNGNAKHELILDDINARLMEGSVSLPR